MNHFDKQSAELIAARAEIAALRTGLFDLLAYVYSPKFSTPGPLAGYVNTADIAARVRDAETAGSIANHAAFDNETGPRPVATYRGWACPTCMDALQPTPLWNDTDAKAESRMRDHWRAAHRTPVTPLVWHGPTHA